MSHTTATTALRNYCVLAVTVVLMSAGLMDSFTNPERVAQQDKFEGYGRYVGVGLVAFSQKSLR